MKKVFAVDEKLYWNFVTDLLCEMTENSDQGYSYYESEEKYVEEEYKEEGFKGVEEELSEYRNKFIEMYTQNICNGRIFPVGKRIRQKYNVGRQLNFTKQMGKLFI